MGRGVGRGAVPQAGGVGAREAFVRGYRDAGGDEVLLAYFVNVVIVCESGWDVGAVSAGGHLGLAQFAPDSWAKAGGGDPFDAYTQGRNVARWVRMTTPSEQWSCW